jgi:hypothetical protein
MPDIQEVLARYAEWGEPHPRPGENLALGHEIQPPATPEEIEQAYPDGVDERAVELWLAAREAELFKDVEYGQWGMHLLTPAASVERTREWRENTPEDFYEGDLVIATFIGDQDFVVISPGEDDVAYQILVAPEMYKRDDWYAVGPSLADVLERYYEALGEKYWETEDQEE